MSCPVIALASEFFCLQLIGKTFQTLKGAGFCGSAVIARGPSHGVFIECLLSGQGVDNYMKPVEFRRFL